MAGVTEVEFWSLIEKHVQRKSDGSIDAMPLFRVLGKMPPQDILEFQQRMSEYYRKSYTWRLWGAAWLIHGGAPDDTFDYFRSWLIGCGRDVYMAALEDPDSLADVATGQALDPELYGIAGSAYESATGERYPSTGGSLPELDKSVDFGDEWEMARVYPRLFAKFGGAVFSLTEEDLLIDRCREYAGAKGRWTREDTRGFFQRFRPDGEGLSNIYAGVDFGNEISRRLIAAMRVDGTTMGKTLAANQRVDVDAKEAVALVKLLCANMRSLAKEVEDDELAEAFTVDEFVIRAGQGEQYSSNELTRDVLKMPWNCGFNIMYESVTPAAGLQDAVSTLVGDYFLTYYIQWPICADRFKTADPFKPFFELWRRGVAWRFTTQKVVEVFTP